MTTSDAPQPPGGPLRDDEPEGPMAPADDVQQDDADRDLQEENAETSLDQPST